ncbi:MAG: hypothetical protein FJ214_11550 [Ignavibacteria bacterium]|nr:hypothetical protein [Ignavibacteria bacterium]
MIAKNILFSFLIILLFVSCNPKQNQFFISKEHETFRHSNVSVLVLPFITKILPEDQKNKFLERKASIKKTLTNPEIELLEAYASLILSENTIAKIVTITNQQYFSEISLLKRQFTFDNGEPVEMFIPNSQIILGENKPDYIFIISDLFFNKNTQDKTHSVGIGIKAKTNFIMEGGIDYLFWDNKKMDAAAFGRLNKSMKLIGYPTKLEYITFLEDFFNIIIEKSPLQKKETNY